jgi:hypothetical protein
MGEQWLARGRWLAGERWLAKYGSGRLASVILVAAVAMVDATVNWGGFGFLPRALVDEPCHLATAVVALAALTRWRGGPPGRHFGWAVLAASVLIDTDHLPGEFGTAALTAGTPRPYTHALWLIVALAAAGAVAWRRAAFPPGCRHRTDRAVVAAVQLGRATAISGIPGAHGRPGRAPRPALAPGGERLSAGPRG